MSQPVIQTSFNAGEWAPALNARVDLAKYHSGAALLRNFFVDYRGGATTRPGTKYIATSANDGAFPPRLIPFQASFNVSFVLEFGVTAGVGYIAFYQNGAQIISGGVPYTIASPYASSELRGIKFVQNVNILILCHPNHPPYQLQLFTATNWTLSQITFGATIAAPTSQAASSSGASGTVDWAYVITAVDVNGQESLTSGYATLTNVTDIRSVAETFTVAWTASAGAVSYNVYRAEPNYSGPVPAGAQFGFVGNCLVSPFIDSNIIPDFSQGPPVLQTPFAAGSGVLSVTITNPGTYLVSVPTPHFAAPGGGGTTATGTVIARTVFLGLSSQGGGYSIGDTIYLGFGLSIVVTGNGGSGNITNFSVISQGYVNGSGAALPSALQQVSTSGSGLGVVIGPIWGISSVTILNPGSGYGSAPAITFTAASGSGGAATAVLGAPGNGNPTVPAFQNQRLCLMGPTGNPEQFNASQPGQFFNYNTTNPIEADDAFQGTLISGQLSTIQSAISQPQGLIVLTDKQAWLINGGSPGTAISATGTVANPQAYNGAAPLPPIVANDNILYVQSKGAIVRDLVFNYYTQVWTGTDISILSSHLFYGYQLLEWAWAEEPFKLVWAVRNDGQLLTLTFLKEQELIAWAHSDTQGNFQSITSVTEPAAIGNVDAIYHVVQRSINGVTVQYIERFVELYYPNGVQSAWCVDAGIQYDIPGAPVLSFSGATQLAGQQVTGLATDDLGNTTVITPFTMDPSGAFTLPPPPAIGAVGYVVVTIGLPYLPQLQTLALDLGEPTVQSKRKKVSAVTVRCQNTLGLETGRTFQTLVPMQDLVLGNVGTMSNAIVTDLVTSDARTVVDPQYDVFGAYCIQQPFPYPASVLGVIPEIEVGDDT